MKMVKAYPYDYKADLQENNYGSDLVLPQKLGTCGTHVDDPWSPQRTDDSSAGLRIGKDQHHPAYKERVSSESVGQSCDTYSSKDPTENLCGKQSFM